MSRPHKRPRLRPAAYEVRIAATEKLIGYFRFAVPIPPGFDAERRECQFALPPGHERGLGPLLMVDFTTNTVWCSALDEVRDCLNFFEVQGASQAGEF